jgi:ATP-dependent DNA helicase RecG
VQLESPLQFVKGVGPRIADSLKAKGIATVDDLLHHLPFRYEDRANPMPIGSLQAGQMASIVGEVRGSVLLKTSRIPIFELTVGQNLATLKCMWFHGTYLKDRFQAGQWVAVYGKPEPARTTRGFKMINPQVEILTEPRAQRTAALAGDASAEPAPRFDPGASLEMGRIVPVYESLGGAKLNTRWLRRVVWNLLAELEGNMPETLPKGLLQRLGLPGREAALRGVHFPPVGTPMTQLQSAATAAQQRLIFEELFYLELGLELKRRRARDQAGIPFATGENVRNALRNVLPFHPTAAQKKALGEIVADMRQPGPMRRLLQGDVGSGKTIVAIQAMLVAIENGYQAALMAPTEILATQHYLAARKLLERAGERAADGKRYRVVLLTGSLEKDVKRLARHRIYTGEADLVIGTHALIEEKVEFAKLGLVVVDEQHRFGVMQRFRLMKKPGAAEPDLLAMTATPIPRTLALTLYGDLEVSVLDELPPGRTPVLTRQVPDERAEEVWKFVREQVERGHQAYIVYPVIEGAKEDHPELDFAAAQHDARADAQAAAEDETARNGGAEVRSRTTAAKRAPAKASKPDPLFPGDRALAAKKKRAAKIVGGEKPTLKSATEMFEQLKEGALAGLRLGLLHGRLSADDKDVLMRRFQRGEVDVLVATTVIEVGVDVPNATMMVIEHAERFGLAQMHQLRGRVGRGRAKSFCILMTGGRVGETSAERLAAMVRTQNGFELAELDLELRGPGEFFGTRQSGLPDFRVASLLRDRELLERAKVEAARFVADADANRDTEATAEEKAAVWSCLRDAWQRRYGLVNAG